MKRLLTSALVLALLSACTYTYIPPVPQTRMREKVFYLTSTSGLVLENERLRLNFVVNEVSGADWLAIQWFAPNNDQAASESLWIEPQDEGATLSLLSPERVTLSPGTWRAVLSFQGSIVRQLAVEIE